MVDVSIQPVSPASARPAAPAQDAKLASSAASPNANAAADVQQAANAQEAAAASAAQRKANDSAAESKEAASKPQLRLSIAYNEEAQRFVYKGLDTRGKTISQYPTEDALKRIAFLRQAISDTLTGASSRGALLNTTL
jgi:uncharacterized FlaG/YvyC family protein